MPGLRSSLLAFLVLAWCHGCICFQSLPLSSPMRCGIAQNSGFASICGSGGPSGASCALLGPARNVRRSRGLKQLGLRGLSSKATPDYYKVLGVDKKADTKEIKRAYKRLAVKFHPDVNKEEGAKNRFVEINEAYSILSDEAERRKYDMRRNPFEGWSAARPGGGTGRQGWSGGGASASGFDFDEYWSQFRSKEETPKDIDDSFEKILDDLFSGVRSRRKVGGGGRRRDSLLDDFGSFLETMLGREDLGGDDAEAEVDGLAEEELRAEADDCAYVVTQLGERATHLRREAVAAEERGAEWDRKGKAAGGETAAAARDKAEALRRSATRLRDRAAKVDEMQLSQKQRLKRLRARLRGEKPPSQSPSDSAGAGGGGGAGDKEVVSCPECFQKLRVPSGRAGTARCPNCSYSWEPNVPASDGAGSEGGAEAAAAERRVVGCPKCAQKIGVPKGRDGFVKCPTCAHQFSTATPGRDASGPEAASRTPPRTAQRFPDQYATSWQEEQKMKQELARAKAEEDLAKLKKELGL